jgi:putative Mg2+ transporter-C (MgtC) family protein
MDLFFNTNEITNSVAVLRLGTSLLAGSIIGLERARRKQNAGLRTHILICLGSTLLMLLSIWLPAQYMGERAGDPGRIAAQVVPGIGFLGAGSIIRLGNTIKGLTTAASLWFVAAIGLVIGAGMYFPAAIALLLSLFALVVLEPVERRLFPAERLKHLVVGYSGNSDFPEKARRVIEDFGVPVQSVDVEKNMKKGEAEVRFLVGIPVDTDTGDLYRRLKDIGGVEKVELKEKF